MFPNVKQKTFSFLKKISAGLAVLHTISFDEYSDVIFWRQSTLIKVSGFEEKEQKNYLFLLKITSIFSELHSVFSEYHLRFFGIKSKLKSSFGVWSERPGFFARSSQKSFHTAFHISKETMREKWLLQKSPLRILNRKRSDLWKFQIPSFFFQIERDDHQFLTEKLSTGLRICNRGVRVWSRRFQTFLRNFSRRLWKLHSEEFLRMLFLRTNFFHHNGFQILGKNLEIFDRLCAWFSKLHLICPEELYEVIFFEETRI